MAIGVTVTLKDELLDECSKHFDYNGFSELKSKIRESMLESLEEEVLNN